MMKRLLFAMFSVLMLGSVLQQTVSAHVLTTDDTGSIGAILHIMPDDDPIAGEPSTLFFDIQSQAFSKHKHTIDLTVTDEQGQAERVPVTFTGSAGLATYTFPQQGAYKLVLAAKAENTTNNNHTYTFTHTQRVSRGVSASALAKPGYAWAEMLLVGCFVLFALLVIVSINRRSAITKQSKW